MRGFVGGEYSSEFGDDGLVLSLEDEPVGGFAMPGIGVAEQADELRGGRFGQMRCGASFEASRREAENAPPVYPLNAARRQQILGLYRRASWRFPARREEARREVLEIMVIDGQLYTQAAGRERQRLLPVSDSLFRRQRDNRATVFVGSDTDGEIYFQEDSDNFAKIDR